MRVEELVNAAGIGNVDEVRRLLSSGVDINGIDPSTVLLLQFHVPSEHFLPV